MQAALQNGASKVVNHRGHGYTDKIKVPQNYVSYYLQGDRVPVVLRGLIWAE